MDIEEFKRGINEALGGSDVADLCSELVDVIARLPEDRRAMLTYNALSGLAGRDKVDTDMVSAINFLTSSRWALLEAHGQFVADDGSEFSLDDDDFQHLLATGELIHPATGDPVPDARTKVMPYFVVNFPAELEVQAG